MIFLTSLLVVFAVGATLGCAGTMLLRDRYWLRHLRAQRTASWNEGWDVGRLCGLDEGKRAAVLQRIEDERHAAP